ncbi:stage II sporulation protein M [Brevibacillus sp. SYP-B805]|uniref:stage II sporulation protein M n=1 Tax=Brevibacillus sp. SYP-B805 TaxID=1578199 RepID=UPI0013EAC10A|nr:stage II sporulation protein M [Brevibacillus sp. SYP-B805]NGQ93846.1 stage II sporulation protein M [Brevibacillus sp. SYP-B805]
MEIASFLKENRAAWSELEQLLERFRKHPNRIRAEEIDRIVLLYKKASAHLAYMRTYHPQDDITQYLNQLVARAHNVTYKKQFASGHQLSRFFYTYFTALIRARLPFIGIACLLFLLGGLFGFASVMSDPLNLYVILPPQIAENVDPSRLGEGHADQDSAIVSAMIMTNNIKVAMLAFVSGITFGTWTIYLLVYNGLIIGALAAVFWQADKSAAFWAYILPHGVIELTAIFIAGGAGLYMGYRMLVPGRYSRKFQLLLAAKESAQLLLGTLPLFVVAGIIEGYVTPSALPFWAKYGVALLTLLLLLAAYLYGLLRGSHKTSLAFISK